MSDKATFQALSHARSQVQAYLPRHCSKPIDTLISFKNDLFVRTTLISSIGGDRLKTMPQVTDVFGKQVESLATDLATHVEAVRKVLEPYTEIATLCE